MRSESVAGSITGRIPDGGTMVPAIVGVNVLDDPIPTLTLPVGPV
jgi:hypothetical protein